jgi:hypothetical protein
MARSCRYSQRETLGGYVLAGHGVGRAYFRDKFFRKKIEKKTLQKLFYFYFLRYFFLDF